MHSHLKLAVKVLGRRKFFTFISLFGISMTLVVLMIAAAVFDDFFAAKGPESRFRRVLMLERVALRGNDNVWTSGPGFAFIERYVRPIPGVEQLGVYMNVRTAAVYRGPSKVEFNLMRTNGPYWKVVDHRFLEGRPFTATEDGGGAFVAIITDQMREKLFGAGPAAGRRFEFDGQSYRVVGVVPRVSFLRNASYADVWVPIGTLRSSAYRHELMGGFNALVLARSRADFPRLKQEFRNRLRSFQFEDPKSFNRVNAGLDTRVEAFARWLTQNEMEDNAVLVLWAVLASAATLFMALPALNLVTLNLSRIMERSAEIGVRKAFGAPRRSLVTQFLLENVVLTLIGGAVGFIISIAALAAINASGMVPNSDLAPNLRVFAWAVALALFFGVFSGTYPAWRMSRLDPVNALRGGEL